MTFLRRNAMTLVFVLGACIVLPALVSACPLCKDAEPSNSVAGTDMWRGMYWSILLMIGVPFGVVGGVIVAILRARRRQEAATRGAPGTAGVPPLPFPETGRVRT
jgi:heme/copper-type cytochrome/quinol oxidase subunit 2